MEATDNLTPHFTYGEFWSNSLSGSKIEPPEEYLDNIFRVAQNLEKIRVAIDRPIRISSGWRSPEWNNVIGGSSKSQHLTGKASDIQCALPLDQLIFYAGKLTIFKGVGISYRQKFLHLDLRIKQTFWYY